MAHEIHKYMARVDGEWPLGGPGSDVEADETHVGGRTTGGKRSYGAPDKTVVFGMVERGGDVMANIVPNVPSASCSQALGDYIPNLTD